MLIVFCAISADVEPEEIQVLVVRASPHPQECVLDQYTIHCIAKWKQQEESWVIFIDQLFLRRSACSFEWWRRTRCGGLSSTPLNVRGVKGNFCSLSSCPLLHGFYTRGMLFWVFVFSIVKVIHLCVISISNKFSNLNTYLSIPPVLNCKWGTWRFFLSTLYASRKCSFWN